MTHAKEGCAKKKEIGTKTECWFLIRKSEIFGPISVLCGKAEKKMSQTEI